MLSQVILIRLKKQQLIIYFKEPIDYVTHNSLIMKLNSFMKYLKNLGYEIYFIDKAYYKARIAYKEKRKYEKTLFFTTRM